MGSKQRSRNLLTRPSCKGFASPMISSLQGHPACNQQSEHAVMSHPSRYHTGRPLQRGGHSYVQAAAPPFDKR
eukprot:4943128-Amphidinium_carterae.5